MNTQLCFLDNVECTIDEYIRTRPTDVVPRNSDGEELMLCHGQRVKPYFRRKNVATAPLTPWHRTWQERFDESQREQTYIIDEGHIRRTDVDLNDDEVIEFQHSRITYEEVAAREHDYQQCGKRVIWVIDGEQDIVVRRLQGNRVFLDFRSKWKYKAFVRKRGDKAHVIYVDIGGEVFCINPNDIRGAMVNVAQPIAVDVFVEALRTQTTPFPVATIAAVKQCRLITKQQGAGNGKTWGIVQLIQDGNYEYETFVYLTKQHSAVHVIQSEIRDQQQRGHLDNIEFQDRNGRKHGKKHVFLFRTKGSYGTWRKLIVGTFDSFVYSLSKDSVQQQTVNKFQAMVDGIIREELTTVDIDTGSVQYAGGINLNKRLLLVGDEMQDLTENYAEALLRLMRDWYVDSFTVGDKLQSIMFAQNAFTFLRDFANDSGDSWSDCFEIVHMLATNICRRFMLSELCAFVNHMVNFERFGLPKVQPYEHCATPEGDSPVHLFSGKTVYADTSDKELINAEVDTLMELYAREVRCKGRKASDFLIVTPFVNKNPLVEAFHQRIREFWDKVNEHSNDYSAHSFFHKSEEGTSIDLSESDELTRIVSIHSSKGDGRPVVFAIGLTQSALQVYTKGATGNLIYESLLHVLLTRMKEKLYVRVEENGDDIHRRITEYENTVINKAICPTFKISRYMQMKKILQEKEEETFKMCTARIIEPSIQSTVQLQHLVPVHQAHEQEKRVIDFKHHKIRFMMMIVHSIIVVVQNENQRTASPSVKKQFHAILHKLSTAVITEYTAGSAYWKHLSKNDVLRRKQLDNDCKQRQPRQVCIPLLKKDTSQQDKVSYTHICESIEKVKLFLIHLLHNTGKECKLTFQDHIVLYHLLEIHEHPFHPGLPVSDLYDIFYIINKASPDERDAYIVAHYECVQAIQNQWQMIFDMHPEMTFYYTHPLNIQSDQTDLILSHQLQFIGWTKEHTITFVLKPQLNELNHNEILLDSIFSLLMLRNVHKANNNHERFGCAHSHRVCVICPDLMHPPYFIEWRKTETDFHLIEQEEDRLKNCLADSMKQWLNAKAEFFYNWFRYKYDEKKSIIAKAKKQIDAIITDYKKYEAHRNADVVLQFLRKIQCIVEEKPKRERANALQRYTEKGTFLAEFAKQVCGEVDLLFEIEDDSSSDEE